MPPVNCLWSYGVFSLLCFESVWLSLLLKTLLDNKYYILWHWLFCIQFLYSMCGNLICLSHILWAFDLSLKLGVPDWYQSRVDRRDASLVRRVLSLVLFWVFTKYFHPHPSIHFSSQLSESNSDCKWLLTLALLLFSIWLIGCPWYVGKRIS
jgi:hypothetical protein